MLARLAASTADARPTDDSYVRERVVEPTFLSERERLDAMLEWYYAELNAHVPFQVALEQLAKELTDILRHRPGRDAAGDRDPVDLSGPPGVATEPLDAFAKRWMLPSDVGVLDLWDSICDGPRSLRALPTWGKRQAARKELSRRRAEPPPTQARLSFDEFLQALPPLDPVTDADEMPRVKDRRFRLRVGDRPMSGVTLTAAEIDALRPEDMEPAGWRRPGSDPPRPATTGGAWSDLLVYDPTGIVGDPIRPPRRRSRSSQASGTQRPIDELLAANEARLRDQGFDRPGPRRRRDEDLEAGAWRLFQRAVLRLNYEDIVEQEPPNTYGVDALAVQKSVRRWAKALKVPLQRGRTARRPVTRARVL